MPHGVTVNFLELLEDERGRRRRLLLALPLLAGAVLFLAELADLPPWGPKVQGTAAALVVGFLVGLAWAWHRGRRREESIRARWDKWMQWSLSTTDLGELEARVEEPRFLVPRHLEGALWGVGALANVLLFVGLWYAWPFIDAAAWIVLLLDGLTLGALAATSAWDTRWTRRLRRALDELIQEGEVGVWGER